MQEFLEKIHEQHQFTINNNDFNNMEMATALPSKNYFYPIRLADLDDTSTSTSEESDCHSFFEDNNDEHHDVDDHDCCRLSADYVFHSTYDSMDEDLSLSPYPFDATEDELLDEYSNDWVSSLQNDLMSGNIILSESMHSICSIIENDEANNNNEEEEKDSYYTGFSFNESNKSPTSTVNNMIEVGESMELENKFRNHPLWTKQPSLITTSSLFQQPVHTSDLNSLS